MKKEYFKVITIFTIITLIIVLLITRNTYIFGSDIDWFNQQIEIPDYFRQLFFKTKNFFPDISYHLGAGQNIYNLSYYGLFNPIILLSYIFVFIDMTSYLISINIIIIIVSTSLLYYLLRSNNISKQSSFISSLIFLFSAPLIYQSHFHLMFSNYFPFLILSLIGVDKYIKKKKFNLLIISCFLMILTSYYFSIGGIIVILIYTWYKSKNKNTIFFIIGFILISVLLSSILIIPTLYTLLQSRSSSSTNIINLLIPNININNILYKTTGLGLYAILLFSLIFNKINNKKNLILRIVLLIIFVIPIFAYLLNGGLYVRGKAFIPFLIPCILIIGLFIDNIFTYSIGRLFIGLIGLLVIFILNDLSWYNYFDLISCFLIILFYLKYKDKKILYLFLIVPFAFMLVNNLGDKYITKDYYNTLSKDININDSSFNRFNNLDNTLDLVNSVSNLNYNTSLYSSTYNKYYYDFFHNNIYNNFSYRNTFTTTNTNNILFQTLMNVKYIYKSTNDYIIGYEEIGTNLYKNDNVLPWGFVNYNLLNLDDYNSLSKEDKAIALVKYIIVDDDGINNSYSFNTTDITNNETIFEDNNFISGDTSYEYTIKSDIKDDDVIMLSFDIDDTSCDNEDLTITINDSTNVLTCKDWLYYNNNKTFHYVLSNHNKKLKIDIGKGTYNISNLIIKTFNYNQLVNSTQNIEEFNIKSIYNNTIKGNIDIKNSGYFMITLGYDKGYTILVDGKERPYQKLSTAFIGLPLDKGYHEIEIIYNAPYKRIGMILSILGIGLLLIINIFSFVQNKSRKTINLLF
ncbi:MAG: YfhO family protein [bacterium]|nr:YfhO family protein [bacterium]